MDIANLKSNLNLKNLFFKELSLKRSSSVENGEYNVDIKRDVDKTGDHDYIVTVTTSIKKIDIEMVVIAVGDFRYDSDQDNEEFEKVIIEKNTVAIMFPFIRSQVSLLSTQPGMSPIILPPINVKKLI